MLRQIVKNDAGENQNVNMLTVSGTLINANDSFGDFVLRETAYNIGICFKELCKVKTDMMLVS